MKETTQNYSSACFNYRPNQVVSFPLKVHYPFVQDSLLLLHQPNNKKLMYIV